VIAGLVALVYLGQARVVIDHPHRFDYVKMDFADLRNGHGSSPEIERAAAEGPVHSAGYDGEFFYFIALDPTGAAPYLGAPAYRYGRIVYPLVARAAALGRPDWIRGSLVVVNALAIAAAAFFFGLIFIRWDLSAWWALLVATYPGLMAVAFTRDTSEPLAYAIALAGMWVLVRAKSVEVGTAAAAGAIFAAAALARETTLLFPLAAAIAYRQRRRAALTLAAVSLLPYAAWKGFLALHFGNAGSGGIITSPVPFHGIFSVRPWSSDQLLVVLTVVVPALIWLVLGVRALFTDLTALLVVANSLFLIFLGPSVFDGYGSTGRVATGCAIAAGLGYPTLRELWGHRVTFAALMTWSLPWWLLMEIPARSVGL